MKTLTLEEMIIDAINNGTKYRLDHFKRGEYIYWDRTINAHSFKDEADILVDLTDFATYLRGWTEHK